MVPREQPFKFIFRTLLSITTCNIQLKTHSHDTFFKSPHTSVMQDLAWAWRMFLFILPKISYSWQRITPPNAGLELPM